jgi:hypothetical protein
MTSVLTGSAIPLSALLWGHALKAAGPVPIVGVAVDCVGDDAIGQSLCYAVKEKIRSSQGFELDSGAKDRILGLHLVSADDTLAGLPQGSVSVVALTVTLDLPSGTNVYWWSTPMVLGAFRVSDTADSIAAKLDFFREGLVSSASSK